MKIGTESDDASGQLTVKNRQNRWVKVHRGVVLKVNVAIDGKGYWHWRNGTTNERSRGGANFRQRVKALEVLHSTEDSDITWTCHDAPLPTGG